MKRIFIAIFCTLFANQVPLPAQEDVDDGDRPAVISGVILDKTSTSPIEYANIVLRLAKDSSVVTGAVSRRDGSFEISIPSPAKYVVDVRFLGFKRRLIPLNVTDPARPVNLGNVYIEPDPLQLKEMVVEGERTPISYHIDKKVIDVAKMHTVISGSAADVLQNVPSVTVDLEGNVSLRGSANFTVLIDGKPTIMEAQDALQQIPATSLEKIEIITNPSAKYDPEGTSGIINILMKKNRGDGISGLVNTNVGLNGRHGGDIFLQYRNESLTALFGGNYNKRPFPGESRTDNSFLSAGSTNYLHASGSNESQRNSSGMRGSVEFGVADHTMLTVGGRLGQRGRVQSSQLLYSEWSTANSAPLYYTSFGNFDRSGNFYEVSLSAAQQFNENGHELKAEYNLGYDDDNESSITKRTGNDVASSGERIDNSGPSRELEGRVDYTLPLSADVKFEAGYEGEAENSEENNNMFQYNSSTGGFDPQPQYDYAVRYRNSDHALYATYTDKFFGIGLQGGIRTEYTFRSIVLTKENAEFGVNRWDWFPTLHTSYKFGEATQAMASYTRRIQRPHGWEMEPYIIWTDANNVRKGNPELQPQFIDSYETGIQTLIGGISLSAEVYYRLVHNKIERVKSVYEPNVTLTSMANIGHDQSVGTESLLILDPLKFWNVNLMTNVYGYKVTGTLPDGEVSRSSFNWSMRFNNVFKMSGTTQLQVNLNYNSPTVSSQGRVEEFFSIDLAAKHSLFDRLLTVTLQARDLFGTSVMENTSQGLDFTSYSYMRRDAPILMLNLRWNFNRLEREREREQEENQNEANGDGGDER